MLSLVAIFNRVLARALHSRHLVYRYHDRLAWPLCVQGNSLPVSQIGGRRGDRPPGWPLSLLRGMTAGPDRSAPAEPAMPDLTTQPR